VHKTFAVSAGLKPWVSNYVVKCLKVLPLLRFNVYKVEFTLRQYVVTGGYKARPARLGQNNFIGLAFGRGADIKEKWVSIDAP